MTDRSVPPYSLADDCATRTSRARFDPALLERARGLLRRHPAISLHDHPIRLPEPMTAANWRRWREDGVEEFGYRGLAASGLAAVFASANSWHSREELWSWAEAQRRAIDGQEGFYRAGSAAGIRAAVEGRTAAVGVFLALETITNFADRPGDVEALVAAGFRMAGLAYDDGNALGGGLGSPDDPGLTDQGRAMISEMNRAGMIVDLSHVGDVTAREAIEHSAAPVVFSHAGARAVWPIPRLKPDDLLLALRDHGGVIGVEAAPNSTCSRSHPRHTIDSFMEHLDYLLELVGPEHVAIGPDTMFGDHAGIHRIRSAPGAPDYSYTPVEPVGAHEEADYVDGLENPRENFVHVCARMLHGGYDEETIARVIGGNALRVIESAFGAATPLGATR